MAEEESKEAKQADTDAATASAPPPGFKETDPFAPYVLDSFPVIGFASQTAFSYNLISMAIALEIIERTGVSVPGWATDLDNVAIYGGAIFGMVTMGFMGDIMGRKPAMTVALIFTILGALGTGFLTYGVGKDTFYDQLGAYRFLIGLGVGGTVPLSSSSSTEVSGSLAKKRWVTVLGYSGNVLGYTMPYVVVLLLAGFHSDYPLMWRMALACGAIPAAAVLQMNMMKSESATYLRQQERMKQQSTDSATEIMECLRQPKYWMKLAGTGGPWFIQNIPVYGIRTFAPTILDEVFSKYGQYESMADLAWQNIVLNVLQIIGLVLTLYMLPLIGPKKILCIAPVICGTFCTIMAILCTYHPDQTTLIFTTFCGMYAFILFGFGTCNYLAASEHYPVEVRTTFAGFSAACSKLGAIAGIIWFDWSYLNYGTGSTLFGCAGWMLLCFVWTLVFCPEDAESELLKDIQAAEKGATQPLVRGAPEKESQQPI